MLFAPTRNEVAGSAFALVASSLLSFACSRPWLVAGDKDGRPQQGVIGINLARPGYDSGTWPFVDVFKASAGWVSGCTDPPQWDDGRTLALDAFGWLTQLEPDQVAHSVVIGDRYGLVEYPVPLGNYQVLWRGEGALIAKGAAAVETQGPGQMVVTLTDDASGLVLDIDDTVVGNHIRDLRVIMPGGRCVGASTVVCQADDDCGAGGSCRLFTENHEAMPFHPVFLSEISAFKLLRFTAWMGADVHPEEVPMARLEWEDYPGRDTARWVPVPVEIMIELSNRLQSDAWFSIPHHATDGFVRRLAEKIQADLDEHLRVYIEYSTRTWDTYSGQFAGIARLGCQTFSSDPDAECRRAGESLPCESPLGDDAVATACRSYRARYTLQRTGEVMAIWENVFSGDHAARLVRVLSCGAGHLGTMPGCDIGSLTTDSVPLHRRLDAVAVDPLMGSDRSFAGVDELFETNTAEVNGAPPGTFTLLTGPPDQPEFGAFYGAVRDQEFLAAEGYDHLQLIAFEGGLRPVAVGGATSSEHLAASRDPRVRDLVRTYLAMWDELSNRSPLVYYRGPGTGEFAIKAYQGEPRVQAPQYDGVLAFLEGLDN